MVAHIFKGVEPRGINKTFVQGFGGSNPTLNKAFDRHRMDRILP